MTPLHAQKEYLNRLFMNDQVQKAHKNDLLVKYGWEKDGKGYYVHPMALTKEEYQTIATQTKTYDESLWKSLEQLWFGNKNEQEMITYRREDGTIFDLKQMQLFKTLNGNIYLINNEDVGRWGNTKDECPLDPHSLLQALSNGKQEYWTEMFVKKYDTSSGTAIPVISVADEYMNDISKFRFTLRTLLFTYFITNKAEGVGQGPGLLAMRCVTPSWSISKASSQLEPSISCTSTLAPLRRTSLS